MPKLIDLTGNKYGRLTVIGRDTEKSKKRVFWLCKCDCGTYTSARSDALGKDINSCGCLKKEQDKENLGRWIPFSKQANNKRGTLWVTHNGEKKSLMEAYREIKPTISYQTVKTRYHKGIRDIDTLFSDKRKQ